MRRLTIVLLLVLLPLRLWAADAMQVGMAAAQAAPAATAAMPADCAMHADAAHHDGGASTAPTDQPPGEGHCTSCQLCASLVATTASAPAAWQRPAHLQPTPGWHVAQAHAARELRPPIA